METNYEHYKKEIDELFEKKSHVGFNVVTNRICDCDDINNCNECKFSSIYDDLHCANRFAMWLVSAIAIPATRTIAAAASRAPVLCISSRVIG